MSHYHSISIAEAILNAKPLPTVVVPGPSVTGRAVLVSEKAAQARLWGRKSRGGSQAGRLCDWGAAVSPGEVTLQHTNPATNR